VVSLFFLADSLKRNDTELQIQLREYRFRLSIISGLFSALSMVALIKGISQFEGPREGGANAIALAETLNIAHIFGVFFVFFVYGVLAYYLLVIFFGFLFRLMFWSK
jgi:hypothetical protein